MRTVPAGLAAILAGTTAGLATLWQVTRLDGEVFRFTDHDRDLTVGGDTYLARTGFKRAAVASASDASVSETEVHGILDSASITAADLRNGVWDYAQVLVRIVSWEDPAAGVLKVVRGRLGEVAHDEGERFWAELRGLTQLVQQSVGEAYSAECRADLGDSRCTMPIDPPLIARSTAYAVADNITRARDDYVRVPIGTAGTRADDEGLIWRCTAAGTTDSVAPTYSGPAGTVVTDGTAEFTAEEAWTVYGVVDDVASRTVFTVASGYLESARHTTGFFNKGVVIFETGALAGVKREIVSWNAGTRTITLFGPTPGGILPGDGFRIQPGCDQMRATCQTRFDNYLNFRGEPFVPGQDALLQVGSQ